MGNDIENIIRELVMMSYVLTIDSIMEEGEVIHYVHVDSLPNKHGESVVMAKTKHENLGIALTKAQAALMVQ